MALKALVLRKKIELQEAELEKLRAKSAELDTREAELEAAANELTAESTQEERSALDEEVLSFEQERSAHNDSIAAVEAEIDNLRTALAAEEARQNTTPPAAAAAPAETEKRGNTTMITRAKIFRNLSIEQREALVSREDVRSFVANVRDHIAHKRAITNVGLTVPEVLAGYIREVADEASIFAKHANVISVAGEARQVIGGGTPEAVWTDCCGVLNELTLGFYGLTMDCYKVGGFIAICNANLEDSDLNLLAEVILAAGKAIAKAVDKAGLYGTGNGMPLGVVTRLAQTSQPAGYPATARPWTDLHTSNIRKFDGSALTGAAFFQALAANIGYAKHKYSNGSITWFMNEATYMTLVAKALSFNASGALVTAMGRTMPVFGGAVEIFDDMADNDIIFGYFDLYTLAERAGIKIASSDEVRFLQDQTVVKATARYDGQPAIAEAFVAVNIANTDPADSMTFAADGANTVSGIVLPAAATVAAGQKLQMNAAVMPLGLEAAITWTSATTAKATIDDNGIVTGVASGTSVITAAAGGQTATCTVTVTSA